MKVKGSISQGYLRTNKGAFLYINGSISQGYCSSLYVDGIRYVPQDSEVINLEPGDFLGITGWEGHYYLRSERKEYRRFLFFWKRLHRTPEHIVEFVPEAIQNKSLWQREVTALKWFQDDYFYSFLDFEEEDK